MVSLDRFPHWLQKGVLAIVPPALLGALFVVVYLLIRAQLEPYRRFLMPTLAEIWTAAFALPAVQERLLHSLGITALIAALGLSASIILGIILGIAMFRSSLMERAIFPYLVILQAIPILAITPLITNLMGYGLVPKVFITFVISFFSIPTTLLFGLKSVDKGLLELFQLQRASWWTMLRKLALPSALPELFAGLRIAAGLAVIGAIVSELFFRNGRGGLGDMIIDSKFNFEYEQMYAALIVSSLLSVAIFIFFSWLGRLLFANWHASES